METIDLRRVTEIHFHRSLPQLCVNRGTVGSESLPAVWHDICVRPEAYATYKCDDTCANCCQEQGAEYSARFTLANNVKALGQFVHCTRRYWQ